MTTDYINNPNQRTPCVLVLDVSASMNEKTPTGRSRIQELSAGLVSLQDALTEDSTALVRVQLAIVSVGGPRDQAEVMMDWTDATHFHAFDLRADGLTPLGNGLRLGLDLIQHAKQDLKASGVSYTRPWMMVISDGAPSDSQHDWSQAVLECHRAEKENKVEIFSIGVDGADLSKMSEFSKRPPLILANMRFRELFVWLSASLSAASRSRPGDQVSLPPTDPWRNVGL
jgi:uncharacterized protein YegL